MRTIGAAAALLAALAIGACTDQEARDQASAAEERAASAAARAEEAEIRLNELEDRIAALEYNQAL